MRWEASAIEISAIVLSEMKADTFYAICLEANSQKQRGKFVVTQP